jgi:hypothetical protein
MIEVQWGAIAEGKGMGMELGKVELPALTVGAFGAIYTDTVLLYEAAGPYRQETESEEFARRCNAHDGLVEALAKFGTITPCLNCNGSGKNQHGACCRISGHAKECKCLACQWKTAYYQLEDKLNALRAAGVEA